MTVLDASLAYDLRRFFEDMLGCNIDMNMGCERHVSCPCGAFVVRAFKATTKCGKEATDAR